MSEDSTNSAGEGRGNLNSSCSTEPATSVKQPVKIGYSVTLFAGLLFASILDDLYHLDLGILRRLLSDDSISLSWYEFYRSSGLISGRLIYSLYDLLLGTYNTYWWYTVLAVGIPLGIVNLCNYSLYRRSATQSEHLFFLLLAMILNSVVIFVSVNILMIHLI